MEVLNFQFEATLLYKYGTIYREVLHLKRFDWCEAMRKKSANNILTKFFIDVLEDSVPSMIHPCPYSEINITRISVKTSTVPSVFPTGDYKCILSIIDSRDHLLVTIFVVGSNNSTNKDTFG